MAKKTEVAPVQTDESTEVAPVLSTKRFLVKTNIFFKGKNILAGSEIELTKPEYNKIAQYVTLITEEIE